MISRLVDTALDRSIAPGYGNAGFRARQRMPDWPADPPRMDGKAVLITGAARGLGLASAIGYAELGATVHALARTEQRATDAAAAIRARVPGADARPASCDVSDLHAVRNFAERFVAAETRLDVLVNNAGVMPDERTTSADGHELMFATHVLAPLALATALTPVLEQTAPARVINVSSGGMYGQSLPVGDWESERATYSPKKLYARTKREEVVVTEFLAQRLRARGIMVHSMHPGWVDTEGVQNWMPVFRTITRPIIRTPAEGADTIVWLGGAPQAVQTAGLFWHDRRPRPTNYRLGASADSDADRTTLWRYCTQALSDAGIDLP